jgi:multiple sugar transport system substrate-binding protein
MRRLVFAAIAALLLAAPAAYAVGRTVQRGSDTVTLTVLEHQQLRVKALKQIIPQFEAWERSHGKDVKVKLISEILPDDQFATKLTLQYSQGKGPDVTSFPASSVPDFAAAGYLSDLTSRVNAWAPWKAHFYPRVRDLSTQANGHIYSLPRGATLLELFYRRDVLTKDGISTAQPANWAALIQRLNQLKAKVNGPVITWPSGTQWGGGTFDEGFLHVFLGAGGKLYDAKTQKWIVKSAALNQAFGFYATLAHNGLLPVQDLLAPQPWQPTKYVAFVKGTIPITTQGSWGWRYDWGPGGSAPIPGLTKKVATWEFPARGGSPFVTANLDWAWGIAKKSKNQDAAWDFVTYLNTGKALAQDITAVGSLSPRNDIQSVTPYSKQAVLVRSERQLAHAKFFRPGPGIAKIQQAVGQATEDILTGKADGPAAAAEFTKQATRLLGSQHVENG